VPLVVTHSGARLRDGAELSDLIPTALAYLGLDVPEQMTGAGVANLA
jgi:bisphosphoglycerate-independent phosphoglycerate mutase (AlkP superfamily)